MKMKVMKSPMAMSLALFAAAIAMVAIPEVLWAAPKNAGEIGTHVAGQGAGVAKGLLYVFYVLGVLFAGGGIVKLINSAKTHEPKGMAIASTVLGAVLLALPTVIGVATQSTLDEGAGGLSDLGISTGGDD